MEVVEILSCIFGLGIVCHAAASTIPSVYTTSKQYNTSNCKVHFLYPRRFGLILFLIAATVWSITQFAALVIVSDLGCNITTIFVAFFDQLARISIIGVALWGVRGPIEDAAERMTLLVFLMLRCILGVVVIAFTRYTFIPVCFPQATQAIEHGRAAGIIQLCYDGVMAIVLLIRAWMALSEMKKAGGETKRWRMLFWVIICFGVWDAATIPFVLGVGSVILRLLPQILALTILLLFIRMFPDIFWFLCAEGNLSRSGPKPRIQRIGSGGFPGRQIPPNTTFQNAGYTGTTPSRSNHTHSTNSSLFRRVIGQGSVHPGNAVPWHVPGERSPQYSETRPTAHGTSQTHAFPEVPGPVDRRQEISFSPHPGVRTSRRLVRKSRYGSPPPSGFEAQSHDRDLSRYDSMRTAPEHVRAQVDAQFEREEEARRQDLAMPITAVTSPTTNTIPSFAGLPQHLSGYVPSDSRQSTAVISNPYPSEQAHSQVGRVESSQISPRAHQPPRRYPVHDPEDIEEANRLRLYTETGFTFPRESRIAARSLPLGPVATPRVLFVHDIQYDNPVLVNSIMTSSSVTKTTAISTGLYTTPQTPSKMLRRSPRINSPRTPSLPTHREEVEQIPEVPKIPPDHIPIIERKRPLTRDHRRERSRVIFPREDDVEFLAPKSAKGPPRARSNTRADRRKSVPTSPNSFPPPAESLPPIPVASMQKSLPNPPASSALQIPRSANAPSESVWISESLGSPSVSSNYETADAWTVPVKPCKQQSAALVELPSRSKNPKYRQTLTMDDIGAFSLQEMSGLRQSNLTTSTVNDPEWTGTTVFVDDDVIVGPPDRLSQLQKQTFLYEDSERGSVSLSSMTQSSLARASSTDTMQYNRISLSNNIFYGYNNTHSGDLFDEDNNIGKKECSSSGEESDHDSGSDNSSPRLEEPLPSTDGTGEEAEDFVYSDDGYPDGSLEEQALQDRLDLNIRALANGKPAGSRFTMRPGDIPRFYTLREGYGGKRKKPPVPLGLLPLRIGGKGSNSFLKDIPSLPKSSRGRSSSATSHGKKAILQARLTMLLEQKRNTEPIEDVLSHLANPTDNLQVPSRPLSTDSDGHGSLLGHLESEASELESKWTGLRKSIGRSSFISILSSPPSSALPLPSAQSKSNPHRNSLLRNSIQNRLSNSSLNNTGFLNMDVPGWNYIIPSAPPTHSTPRLREDFQHIIGLLDTQDTVDGEKPQLPTPQRVTAMHFTPSVQMYGAVFVMASGPEGDTIVDLTAPRCPDTKPPVEMLWKPRVKPTLWEKVEKKERGVGLWTTGAASVAMRTMNNEADPAALETRPMKRFDDSLPEITSSGLWMKEESTLEGRRKGALLWSQPRRRAGRSILMLRRKPSLGKKVMFTTNVVTVEATGALGRLQHLAAESHPPELPPIPKLEELKDITRLYQTKALPAIPPLPSPANSSHIEHTPGDRRVHSTSTSVNMIEVHAFEPMPVSGCVRQAPELVRKDSDTPPEIDEPIMSSEPAMKPSLDYNEQEEEELITIMFSPTSPKISFAHQDRELNQQVLPSDRKTASQLSLPKLYKQNGVWISRPESRAIDPVVGVTTKTRLIKSNGVWKSVEQIAENRTAENVAIGSYAQLKETLRNIEAISRGTNEGTACLRKKNEEDEESVRCEEEAKWTADEEQPAFTSQARHPNITTNTSTAFTGIDTVIENVGSLDIDSYWFGIETLEEMTGGKPEPEASADIKAISADGEKMSTDVPIELSDTPISRIGEDPKTSSEEFETLGNVPSTEIDVVQDAVGLSEVIAPANVPPPFRLFKQNGVWKVTLQVDDTSILTPFYMMCKQNGVWKRRLSSPSGQSTKVTPVPQTVRLNGSWKVILQRVSPSPVRHLSTRLLSSISGDHFEGLHIGMSAIREGEALANESSPSAVFADHFSAGRASTALRIASPFSGASALPASATAVRCMGASLVVDVKDAQHSPYADHSGESCLDLERSLTASRKAPCGATGSRSSLLTPSSLGRGIDSRLSNSVNGTITPPIHIRLREDDIDGTRPPAHPQILAPDSAANKRSGPAPRTNIRVGLHILWALDITQPLRRPADEESQLALSFPNSSPHSSPHSSPLSSDMAATVSARPQLWTKSTPSTADLFSNPPPPTLRPKPVQRPDPAPASGTLWTKAKSSTPAKPEPVKNDVKPELWRPEPDKSLWSHRGEEVTLEDLAAARREVAEAWCQERHTGGLFAGHDIQSARSKREGVLPKVEEGLWRKKVAENEEKTKAPKSRHTTLWVGRSPPPPQTSSSQDSVTSSSTPSNSSTSLPSSASTPATLWSSDTDPSTAPSLFAHLPTNSIQRSKKETSTDNLPVFSEDLWKERTPLPPQPSLWTPPIRPTGLWTASPTTIGPISLQELAAERKHAQKMLWSRKRARRTTDARPVDRTQVPFRPSNTPLPVMSGPMWTKPAPAKHNGLWKRKLSTHTVAPDTVAPKGPLWNKSTARRTTNAKPMRSEPKKLVPDNSELPKFAGPMWTKSEAQKDSEKKLWEKDEPNPPCAPRLWNQQPTRMTAITKPERIPEMDTDALVSSFSRTKTQNEQALWSRPPSPVKEKALWQPPSSSAPSEATTPTPKPEASIPNLWSRSTARRTTESSPVRPDLMKRKPSEAPLEKASGALWTDADIPPALTRVSTYESEDAVSDGEDSDCGEYTFSGIQFGGFGAVMGGAKARAVSTGSAGEGPMGEWLWTRRESEVGEARKVRAAMTRY